MINMMSPFHVLTSIYFMILQHNIDTIDFMCGEDVGLLYFMYITDE